MKGNERKLWILLVCLGLATLTQASADEPDWSEGVAVPAQGRANPYRLPAPEFKEAREQGLKHVLSYPIQATGMLMPYRPVESLLDSPSLDPFRMFVQTIIRDFAQLRSMDDLYARVGLLTYPADPGRPGTPYHVPTPDTYRPGFRMGIGTLERGGALGFTVSCAACHTANLFGRRVIGMTNRFPRANNFFVDGKSAARRITPSLFALGTGADAAERKMYSGLRNSARFIGAVSPSAPGLDTSLAQVALSLAHRAQDGVASRDPRFAAHPRPEPLETHPADSKPAVWWNLKYKNRWLSDGSVVSGNPVYTNILWNEVGRGADLQEIEAWLDSNPGTIRELTTAVFSSEAPRFTDFFPAESVDLESARRGEKVFEARCTRCHGRYEKAWSLPGAARFTPEERLRTIQVAYPKKTRVIDVGTDPGRAEGMASLEKGLNPLDFSSRKGILIRAGRGYVPPPLVGIWARWPYFHNNSAPSLCAVLSRASLRPRTYVGGEANDPERDFDRDCNGYPSGSRVPEEWSSPAFDTTRDGLSNRGHDQGILTDQSGHELMTSPEKQDLIHFLQTL